MAVEIVEDTEAKFVIRYDATNKAEKVESLKKMSDYNKKHDLKKSKVEGINTPDGMVATITPG